MVPARWRAPACSAARWPVLRLDETRIELRRGAGRLGDIAGGKRMQLREVDALLKRVRRAPVIRFERSLGLRRLLKLPVAAKSDLHQLLAFEMDRLTPFAADEVYHACRVIGVDRSQQQIEVE